MLELCDAVRHAPSAYVRSVYTCATRTAGGSCISNVRRAGGKAAVWSLSTSVSRNFWSAFEKEATPPQLTAHDMSSLATKLSLRTLSSYQKVGRISRLISTPQGRRLFYSHCWDITPKSTVPNRNFHGTRTSKEDVKQHQEKDVTRVFKSDGSNVRQKGENPARHIAVNIDGVPKMFDTVFLRDSCTCPQCLDPYSKNKLFQTSDIPEVIQASWKTMVDEEKGASIELEWKSDVKGYGPDHRTRHSIEWLQRALNTEVELKSGVRHDDRVLWHRQKITQDNKWLDYTSYMTNESTLFDALTHLNKYGLLFIKNVPDSEDSVVQLASRIGTLKDTFYGRTWDVRSKPEAENIAYTPQFLGLHMDLLYTSNPPHLQLLHSLRARTPGGESFFSDSFHAARQLRDLSQEWYKILCTFPVTYHYHHPESHYHFTRPVIDLYPLPDGSSTADPAIHRVNWSPPFQAPFEAHIGSNNSTSLRSFIAASHAYEKLLSSEENLHEYRLNEGECVIFDNRRILHARKAFDATKGERWLKGAYVDDDVFFSRLRVLQEKFEGGWVAEGVERRAVR
jgi:gamma-butyrobetaine dioxygenase